MGCPRGLVESLAEVPPPPCEVFACGHREKCASEQLACTAFQFYVRTGQAVAPGETPSKYTYLVVMNREDYTHGGDRTTAEAANGQ